MALAHRTKPKGRGSVIWDELSLPWRRCLEEAWTAYRCGSIPTGAAIADGRGRVVSGGRNRAWTDQRGCLLYTTTEPCPLCTGAIRVSKLRGVRYASRGPSGESVELLGATDYMRRGTSRWSAPNARTWSPSWRRCT